MRLDGFQEVAGREFRGADARCGALRWVRCGEDETQKRLLEASTLFRRLQRRGGREAAL